MTLMDAPKFDSAGSRRRTQLFSAVAAGLVVLLLAAWLVAGRPIDFPWTWWTYWSGERTAEHFLQAVESNDLQRAYGIWENDADWQQHKEKYLTYSFDRFSADWGQNSAANEYGTITSHQFVIKKVSGSVLIVGAMINGRKSKPLFLAYDKHDHTLGFSPFELRLNQ